MSSQQELPGDRAGSTVTVEVLAFRVTAQNGLAYRLLTGELGAGRHPDVVARALLGLSHDTRAHLLHSTSWRYEHDGRLVLTYACCPDPRPEQSATPLRNRTLAYAGAPASPTPETLGLDQVAAHAARHLAFLHHTDPTARQVIESTPGLPESLAHWPPTPATQLSAV